MNQNILIGGAAGQGMETLASILEKLLKRKGFEIFTTRDYMSRVRGGHNFIQVRFGNEELTSHRNSLDGIIALNAETISNHIGNLSSDGFIICDEELSFKDSRVLSLPLKSTAKLSGDPKTIGSVALGAVLTLFDMDKSYLDGVLEGIFEGVALKQNLSAISEGSKLVKPKYKILSKGPDEKILINGNEALALGALAAGLKFYSAYPMTPSTSIMDYLASKMEKCEVLVEQAEDEIAAINMAIGASFTGVRSMTGTSGGGFALMVEALGLSGMMEIPLVVAEIQRPGPTTGFPTRTEQSDLKFVISASQGEFPRMVIALKNPEDSFYQTVRAFNLADKYQIPIILLGDQFLADSSTTIFPFDFSKVEINRYLSNSDYEGSKEYKRYEFTETGISPRILPGKVSGKTILVDSDEHDETGHITESAEMRTNMVDKRMMKLEYLSKELSEPEFIGNKEFDVLLLAWGSLDGPLKEAIGTLNQNSEEKYGALIFGDIWPLPQEALKKFAKSAKRIINVEQNATGQLAEIISEVTRIECSESLLKYDGRQISSEEIIAALKSGNTPEAGYRGVKYIKRKD